MEKFINAQRFGNFDNFKCKYNWDVFNLKLKIASRNFAAIQTSRFSFFFLLFSFFVQMSQQCRRKSAENHGPRAQKKKKTRGK